MNPRLVAQHTISSRADSAALALLRDCSLVRLTARPCTDVRRTNCPWPGSPRPWYLKVLWSSRNVHLHVTLARIDRSGDVRCRHDHRGARGAPSRTGPLHPEGHGAADCRHQVPVLLAPKRCVTRIPAGEAPEHAIAPGPAMAQVRQRRGGCLGVDLGSEARAVRCAAQLANASSGTVHIVTAVRGERWSNCWPSSGRWRRRRPSVSRRLSSVPERGHGPGRVRRSGRGGNVEGSSH